MRKLFLNITLSIFSFLSMHVANCQIVNKFNYQAVIRNNSNELLVSKQIRLRISILRGSVAGSAIYTELHNPTTT